jgi:hypothetical protein
MTDLIVEIDHKPHTLEPSVGTDLKMIINSTGQGQENLFTPKTQDLIQTLDMVQIQGTDLLNHIEKDHSQMTGTDGQ